MEVFGLLLISLFAEVVFWGAAYLTGCALTPIVSLGKWKPSAIERDVESKKVVKHQLGFKLTEIGEHIYLSAFGVAFIGMTFWVSIVVCLLAF